MLRSVQTNINIPISLVFLLPLQNINHIQNLCESTGSLRSMVSHGVVEKGYCIFGTLGGEDGSSRVGDVRGGWKLKNLVEVAVALRS